MIFSILNGVNNESAALSVDVKDTFIYISAFLSKYPRYKCNCLEHSGPLLALDKQFFKLKVLSQ